MNAFKIVGRKIPISVKSRLLYRMSTAGGQFNNYIDKPKAVIALAADYANYGDVAITHAQGLFLRECLPTHEILFFPCASTYLHMKALKQVCTPRDIVTLVGGGNMGDQYATLEDARRFVIEQFPDNPIISFPQTIDFSGTDTGKLELDKSRRVYGRHKNLQLFAREPVSYEIMRRAFPATPVDLAPDIALSLKVPRPQLKREGVLVCVRDDAESAFPSGARAGFMERLISSIPDACVSDTVTRNLGRLSVSEGVNRLHYLFEAFCRSEVVVTDRLHGMIFAAITGTPCVVLQNANHKIKATQSAWLESLASIRIQEGFDVDQTLHLVEILRNQDYATILLPEHAKYYASLKEAVARGSQ